MLKMKEQPTKQQMREPRRSANSPAPQKQSLTRRILMFPITRLLIAATMFVIVFVTIVIPSTHQSLISNIGTECVLVVMGIITLVLMSKFIEQRSLAEVGLGQRGLLCHASIGIGIATAMLLLIVLVLKLAYPFVEVTPNNLVYDSIWWQPLGTFGYPVAIFVLSCFVAVFEEIMFRGLFFRILEEALGSWLALIISALLFGMVHLINNDSDGTLVWVTPTMAMGLSLAAAYMLTRNLWLTIGFHWAWDFLTQTYLYPPMLPLRGLLLIVFPLILAAGLLALAKRRGQIHTLRWTKRKKKPTNKELYDIDENAASTTGETAVDEELAAL
jgi:membrane protease YdiL (CAAX protease family)